MPFRNGASMSRVRPPFGPCAHCLSRTCRVLSRFLPRLRLIVLAVLTFGTLADVGRAQPYSFSTEELMQGFMKTVFGLEYRSWSWQPYLVKKYDGEVRFHVYNLAAKNRRPVVNAFLQSLSTDIRGLKARIVTSPADANFHVYVVDRKQYATVVRSEVYQNATADAPGRCLVRVESDRRGISRSAAVIVSDEGDFLFRRCLVEEVLQGLGPMNDDASLAHSVFNDHSRHSRFTTFDRYILNMLYDPSIRPGMTPKDVEPLLPSIIRRLRPYIR